MKTGGLNDALYESIGEMYRLKTTRRVKRPTSPPITMDVPAPVEPISSESFDKQMVNFFEAESAAVSLSKPWLRLERGIRLQKYRAFAESYPGLSKEEKESLYKVLLHANDAKLLNTKQHIQYENGVIQSVRGLKMLRTGDGPATFKIDTLRSTKKNIED